MSTFHGTSKGWGQGCRCKPCRNKHFNEMRRSRNIAKITGTFENRGTRLVPIEPSRNRLREVMRQHRASLESIAEVIGVRESTLGLILYRTGRMYVRKSTHDRVMSDFVPKLYAPGGPLNKGSKINAAGTVRRVQALVWMGYPLQYLAHQAGLSPSTVRRLANGNEWSRTTEEVRDKVVNFYDKALLSPPPEHRYTKQAKQMARERGYFPPGAWARIDDPFYKPSTGSLSVREAR